MLDRLTIRMKDDGRLCNNHDIFGYLPHKLTLHTMCLNAREYFLKHFMLQKKICTEIFNALLCIHYLPMYTTNNLSNVYKNTYRRSIHKVIVSYYVQKITNLLFIVQTWSSHISFLYKDCKDINVLYISVENRKNRWFMCKIANGL